MTHDNILSHPCGHSNLDHTVHPPINFPAIKYAQPTVQTSHTPVKMKTVLQQLLCVASFVIVNGGHMRQVIGVKDARGQCLCSVEVNDIIFPVQKVEALETNFYNLTGLLQNHLNQIYKDKSSMATTAANLTELEKRVKYAKTFGTHIDLDFKKLINDIQTVVSIASSMQKNATTPATNITISSLMTKVNNISTLITTMEQFDRNNIITAQREIIALRKKLQECEEEIVLASGIKTAKEPPSPPTGKCDHQEIQKVSEPVLEKLNWKGSSFKAGSWGKDFALGTKFSDYYWVFPANQDGRTMQNYRLYASHKKLLLYSPIREFSLKVKNNDKCEYCGQGAGVVFYNGSFFYNCFDSRALCRADPFNMRLSHQELKDKDPASFNDWFSYKGVKYQDMDLAGDEKGLWLIHGSTAANGNAVIKKVDPVTLTVGPSWNTTQQKITMTNTFMICGVLYATRKKNTTHEEIYYMYDTNTSKERNIQIFMEKPLPNVQSLNYNPNDQKLYMFNDGYLVWYNLTFTAHRADRLGRPPAVEQGQESNTQIGGPSMVHEGETALVSMGQPSSNSNQQQDSASQRESSANQEEKSMPVTPVRQDTAREEGQSAVSEGEFHKGRQVQ
ncbi:olfactomedin-like [Lacerta agilis]|uniref:olfactomedin-like n=1 Tax=Lacerta agilis TaxID=80427 RepID=UPI001419DFB2|nr:olfactomedin-like [Lacerta agilis]